MYELVSMGLQEDWEALLSPEFSKPYMQTLWAFLDKEQARTPVYPPAAQCFRALQLTALRATRVVILGQDPYHGPGQANGLAFSVNRGVAIPPSLRNIYRELNADLSLDTPNHGDLSLWAEQGVLLLNTVLTVAEGAAGSHQGLGWEQFTDRIVNALSNDPLPKVFLLWGKHAQSKGASICRRRHLIIETAHPSPLSAHRGFLGCRAFSVTNEALTGFGRGTIDWQLPE